MAEEKIGCFSPQREDIDAYLYRLEHFLRTKQLGAIQQPPALAAGADQPAQQAHAVAVQAFNTRDELRKSWLISTIGSVNVQLLKDACFPDSPDDRTYEQLCTVLRQHYNPARDKYKQRDAFYSRKQQPGEKIADYSIALRHLTVTCQFGAFLDEALQTQFRNGIRSSVIKEKLALAYDNFQALSVAATELELKFPDQVNYVFKKRTSGVNQKPAPKPAKGGSDRPQQQHVSQQGILPIGSHPIRTVRQLG